MVCVWLDELSETFEQIKLESNDIYDFYQQELV